MTFPRRRSNTDRPPLGAQRGAATLLVTVLITLALGLTIAVSARVMRAEQRRAANDYQAQQACASAQAGLAAALRQLGSRRRLDLSFDDGGRAYVEGPSSTLSNGATFTAAYTNEDLRPFDSQRVWIEARGHSAHGDGECRFRQLLQSRNVFDNLPQVPLISKDDIRLSGAVYIANAHGLVAAWAGGTISADQITVQLAQTPPRGVCDSHGLCALDQRLARLNNDAFFTNFFAYPPAGIKAFSRTVHCGRCRAADLSPPPEDAPIWLYAPADMPVELPRGDFGTAEHPLVLVVDGDLRTTTPTRLFGVVLIRGRWEIDGGVEIHGIVLSNGAVTGRGRLDLIYDPMVTSRVLQLSFYVKASGGWSDLIP
jgi:hypothetical protein